MGFSVKPEGIPVVFEERTMDRFTADGQPRISDNFDGVMFELVRGIAVCRFLIPFAALAESDRITAAKGDEAMEAFWRHETAILAVARHRFEPGQELTITGSEFR